MAGLNYNFETSIPSFFMSRSKMRNSSNFDGRRFNDGFEVLSIGGVSSDMPVNLIFRLSPGSIFLQCHHFSNVCAA